MHREISIHRIDVIILRLSEWFEAVQIAKEAGILKGLMQEITGRIEESLNHRSYGRLVCGAVIFSNEHGYLGQTEHADMLMREIRKKTQKEEKK